MNMSNYATEIQNIARILRNKNLCLDTSPLTSHLYDKRIHRVESLNFRISDVPRNTIPKLVMLNVLLDVMLEDGNSDIPISKYYFRMTVEGMDENSRIKKSSWHLDYDNSDNQEYAHPCFHLTWGGGMIKDLDLGDVLFLPTPRISYPPMDIVLGIDFVLSNFIKSDVYKQIQSDSQYKAAVKNAQEKYWRPYMVSLAHHWCNNHCSQFDYKKDTAKKNHPTLID